MRTIRKSEMQKSTKETLSAGIALYDQAIEDLRVGGNILESLSSPIAPLGIAGMVDAERLISHARLIVAQLRSRVQVGASETADSLAEAYADMDHQLVKALDGSGGVAEINEVHTALTEFRKAWLSLAKGRKDDETRASGVEQVAARGPGQASGGQTVP